MSDASTPQPETTGPETTGPETSQAEEARPEPTRQAASAPEPATAPRVSGRHPVNVGHLVMGIAFVGLALVWSLFANDVVQGEDVRWLLPVPWVLAGAVGLTVTAVTGTRKYQTRQTGWVGHQEEQS